MKRGGNSLVFGLATNSLSREYGIPELPRAVTAETLRMSTEQQLEFDSFLYDARLIHADLHRRILSFTAADTLHKLRVEHPGSFSVGAIGRLRLPGGTQTFAFQIYADQRLRRAPETDDKLKGRWGWRIGERRFAVQLGVLPGRNGSVIARDTEHVDLELPREFIELCKRNGCNPKKVLEGFVSDSSELSSVFERPREDGYANNGPEPVTLADRYFSCVFKTPEDMSTVVQKRRGRRPRAAAPDPLKTDHTEGTQDRSRGRT
jgi:hypothetical protein